MENHTQLALFLFNRVGPAAHLLSSASVASDRNRDFASEHIDLISNPSEKYPPLLKTAVAAAVTY